MVRAYESLTEGWRKLLSRSSGALTHFDASARSKEQTETPQAYPRWSLLAAETWETAQSVIVRMEVSGMRREDIDISIHRNLLRISGEKRPGGEHQDRLYRLAERTYGRFERTIPVPHGIDRKRTEMSYKDGVITVILPKTATIPSWRLTIS
ncbi:MAG: Hsp20/alpha crystallin family protein [Betaproteobacteria bacterium]